MNFPRTKAELAAFCGFDLAGPPVKEICNGYWSRHTREVEVTQEERFDRWWREYCIENAKIVKRQTTTQFVQECLSLGFGVKKGSVEARRKAALTARPDLLEQPKIAA